MADSCSSNSKARVWTQIHGVSHTAERVNDFCRVGDEWWTVSSAGLVHYVREDDSHTSKLLTRGFRPLHLRCIDFLPDGSMGWIGVYTGKEGTAIPRLFQYTPKGDWRPVEGLPDSIPDGICGVRLAGQHTVFATGSYQESSVPGLWRCRADVDPTRWQHLEIQNSVCDFLLTHLIDLHFWNADEGLVVGGHRGQDGIHRPMLLRTEDRGDSWRAVELPDLGPSKPRSGPEGRYAWKLHFIDDNRGYMSISTYAGAHDDPAFLLKTTDAGETWSPIAVPRLALVSSNIRGVGFIDQNHGFTCGHLRGLLETSDGGETWRSSDSGISDANRFRAHNGRMWTVGNGFYRYA